jgi:hypothetical protein
MKEFVDEQAVSGAIFRLLPNFSVEADMAQGTTVTAKRAWRNLLEVLQELVDDVGGGDFDVIGTAPATFQFRFYFGQRGADRRLGNTAGNPPVVFSYARGTLVSPQETFNRAGEMNAVTVGGQGEGSGRQIVTLTTAAIADTPWNRCEGFRDASGETGTAGLNSAGYAALQDGQAQESYKFELAQSPGLLYGRDYCVNGAMGDLITIEKLDGSTIDKKIVTVEISVRRDEDIKLTVADIPNA